MPYPRAGHCCQKSQNEWPAEVSSPQSMCCAAQQQTDQSVPCCREPPEDGLMCELLWSDPADSPGRSPSKRGVGVGFGPDVTKRFLNDNGLQLLVRSHEVRQPRLQQLLAVCASSICALKQEPLHRAGGELGGEQQWQRLGC